MGTKAQRSAPSFDALQRASWRLDHRFKVRTIEWSKVYDDTGTLVAATVGGQPLYAQDDFSALLPR